MNSDFPPLARAAELLGGEVRGGEIMCPGPGHTDSDRSLSVRPSRDNPEGFITHSFAGDGCGECREHVRKKCGLPEPNSAKATQKDGGGGAWQVLTEKDKRNSGGKKNAKGNGADKQRSTIVARFVYRDEHIQPYLRVTRTADKRFWQERWDELWRSGAPSGPKIPYRLPELIAATPTQPVYVTEGEGKADLLAALGFISTSASGGAGKWTSDLNKWFKGRHVIVLPDHDEPGARHGQLVARNLHGIAASVKVVELPGVPHKGDVKQWLETDPSGTRLVRECERAALWQPTANADNKSGHGDGEGSGDGSGDDDNLILELSALGALQYAKRRKEAAKILGIGVGELDKVVAQARAELGGKDDAPVLYEYWIVECSSEPVDGEALLRQLMDCLKRYVVMTEDQTVVVALWIIFTWLHGKIAVHSPLLLVTSPQANSGKSTLLGVISFLACRALQSVSISGPALFRSIEKWQPTFVIDEADTVLVHNEDLKEVVNSGWTRGQCVIRCDPDTHEPRPYSTFAPKAIGMKGRKLPDTTLSRAIIVAIKRKRPDEITKDFDHLDTEDFGRLRQQIARWVRDNTDSLGSAEPESPVGFHNRVRANWRLLLAIAERAGGGWKLRAQRAARAIEEVHDTFEPAIGIRLLADIRIAFHACDTERMTSAVMIAELVKDEEGPWVEYGKGGMPITQKKLADLLKEFGIRRPRNVRPATGGQGKGYYRADFEDAWERYLPGGTVQSPSQTVPPSHHNDFNSLGPEQTVPADFFGTDQNGANALKTMQRDGGTLEEDVSCVPEHTEHVEGARNGSAGVACRAGEQAYEGPKRCVQCNGPPDGKEQLCSVGGRSIWLHLECEPHYFKAIEELEGLPW